MCTLCKKYNGRPPVLPSLLYSDHLVMLEVAWRLLVALQKHADCSLEREI